MKKIDNLEIYTIDIDSNIYQCLAKFEINNVRTILVVKNNIVVGTLTDGDIRKALLNNRMLSMPVMHLMNSNYHFGLNQLECKEVLDKYPYIFMVPLVGERKQLIGLFVRDI